MISPGSETFPVAKAHTWTLREALDALLIDPVERLVVGHLRAAEKMPTGWDIPRIRTVAWDMIRAKMAAANATMTGFLPGAIEPTPIHRDFALDATPDFDGNTVTLGAVVYHGVRVSDAIHAGNLGGHASKRPKVDQALANTWMHSNAKVGSKRENTLKDCMISTGCTDQQARIAWTSLPQHIKGTRGSKKT